MLLDYCIQSPIVCLRFAEKYTVQNQDLFAHLSLRAFVWTHLTWDYKFKNIVQNIANLFIREVYTNPNMCDGPVSARFDCFEFYAVCGSVWGAIA